MMIERSQQLVEAKYSIANGFQHDAKVHVYSMNNNATLNINTIIMVCDQHT